MAESFQNNARLAKWRSVSLALTTVKRSNIFKASRRIRTNPHDFNLPYTEQHPEVNMDAVISEKSWHDHAEQQEIIRAHKRLIDDVQRVVDDGACVCLEPSVGNSAFSRLLWRQG